MKDSNLISNAIHSMFHKNNLGIASVEKAIFRPKKGKAAGKEDLELALTVMLVELAASDQNFDQKEYQVISEGLRRVFGTSKTEVSALVNHATLVLANLRGTSTFAELLRENMDEPARIAVMEVINEVIEADGVEDGFETYLRHKFSKLLDVKVPAPDPKESQN